MLHYSCKVLGSRKAAVALQNASFPSTGRHRWLVRVPLVASDSIL